MFLPETKLAVAGSAHVPLGQRGEHVLQPWALVDKGGEGNHLGRIEEERFLNEPERVCVSGGLDGRSICLLRNARYEVSAVHTKELALPAKSSRTIT